MSYQRSPALRRRANCAARQTVACEQLVSAALACAEAAADLTAAQLAAYGGDVTAATEHLGAALAGGEVGEIETAARDLSAAVRFPALADEDPAEALAYLGAVLHLRGRLRLFDEATVAAAAAHGTGLRIVSGVPERPPVPHQLPGPPPVTRPHVRDTVERMLRMHACDAGDQAQEIFVLTGPPGSGSTTAALAFLAALVRPDRADLYVDLGHDDPPFEPILHRLLSGPGIPAGHIRAGTDDRTARWRSHAPEPLLLIDGAVTAAQVQPLLPAAGVVVVTSRLTLPELLLDGAILLIHETEETR